MPKKSKHIHTTNWHEWKNSEPFTMQLFLFIDKDGLADMGIISPEGKVILWKDGDYADTSTIWLWTYPPSEDSPCLP